MTHPSSLHFIGSHDDDEGVLLPHHAPEVIDSSRQAALCRDVVTITLQGLTTDVVSIDVV